MAFLKLMLYRAFGWGIALCLLVVAVFVCGLDELVGYVDRRRARGRVPNPSPAAASAPQEK